MRGPEDLPPVDLWDSNNPLRGRSQPLDSSRQKAESREQVTESFCVPEVGSQLDGARIPTDEVRPLSGAFGHGKEYRSNEPKSDTPAKNQMRQSVSEER